MILFEVQRRADFFYCFGLSSVVCVRLPNLNRLVLNNVDMSVTSCQDHFDPWVPMLRYVCTVYIFMFSSLIFLPFVLAPNLSGLSFLTTSHQ